VKARNERRSEKEEGITILSYRLGYLGLWLSAATENEETISVARRQPKAARLFLHLVFRWLCLNAISRPVSETISRLGYHARKLNS